MDVAGMVDCANDFAVLMRSGVVARVAVMVVSAVRRVMVFDGDGLLFAIFALFVFGMYGLLSGMTLYYHYSGCGVGFMCWYPEQ